MFSADVTVGSLLRPPHADLLHVDSRPISCSREIAGEREPDVVV